MKMAILATALAGALATQVPARAADSTDISVVLSHVNFAVGEEVFLYAVPKAMGYFAAEHLDVTLLGAAGGVQGGQVLQSGRAQIGASLAEGVLQMREQGATPEAFFTLKQNNGYWIGVAPDSPIKTLADLKGKIIGFPVAGGGSKMIVDESLREAGIDPAYTPVVIGYGPAAAVAIDDKKVDAAMLWDAAYAAMENKGMKFRYIELPIQDKIAGFSLMATQDYIATHPEVIAGYCRAATKGLVYTMTNKAAAVEAFFKTFPQTVPANVDHAAAVAQGVHVLDLWLDRAMKGVSIDAKLGAVDPQRWAFSAALYPKYGLLKGTSPVTSAYTTQFIDHCNDFDRVAVEAQAKAN